MRFKVYLREVAEFQKGFAFKSKDYVDKGTKIVKVSNLTADSIDISQCVCIENNLAKKYITKYDLNLKDIIITTVGSWPTNPASVVGKVVRVPKIAENTLLNQNAVRVRGNERVTQDYLYYLLKDKSFKSYIVGTAQGSANQASITQEDIKNFSFYLPPLEEQEAIADILSSLDDKIELNNQMNETLEEMAQALFKQWFVDFEFPNEEDQPYKSSSGEMVESELGMIPKGWDVKSLDQIASFLNGLAMQKFRPNEDEDSLPVLKIKELRQEKVTSDSDRCTVKIDSKYKVNDGDVIFSWSGTLDARIWCGGEVGLNQHLFKVTSDLYPKWFYYMWVVEYLHQFIRIAADRATTMGHIKRQHLTEAKVLVPSREQLDKMGKVLEPIIEKIIQNKVEKRSLESLRDTVLPKLMSGEIRVSDIES